MKVGRGLNIISEAQKEAFQQALDAVKLSPRYPMVRLLQIGALVGKHGRAAKAVADMTLEGLLGTDLSKIFSAQAVGPVQVEELTALFRRLAGRQEEPLDEPVSIEPLIANTVTITEKKSIPGELPDTPFSSMEMEQRIKDLAAKLRAAPGIGLLQSKILQTYWKDGWPRAPFEEALTLGQVSKIDVESLLRKKGFRGRKVLAFIKALEGALTEAEVMNVEPDFSAGIEVSMPEKEMTLVKSPKPSSFEPKYHQALPKEMTLIEAAAYRHLESVCGNPYLNGNNCLSPLEGFFTEVLNWLTPASCLEIWHQGAKSKSASTLTNEFTSRCPDVYRQWELLLQGTGIPFHALSDPFLSPNLDDAGQRLILWTVATAMDVKHPIVFGRVFVDLVTLKAQAAEMIVKGMVKSLPKASNRKLLESLKEVLSSFDQEGLANCLRDFRGRK